MTSGQQQAPEEMYGVFCGDINAVNVPKILQNCTTAINAGVKHLHLMFQTWGGFVGDGVCLYNFFRTMPLGLTLYNVGAVQSIGVIAFLGAKERKASTYAAFMIHRSQVTPQAANAQRLKVVTDSLLLDDARTESILRKEVTLPQEQWEIHKFGDLHLSAEQALEYGIATSIGEFSPPARSKIFQV